MNDDAFLDALQGALGVPDDLELGHDLRACLLAAAIQAPASAAAQNVVPFQQATPLERNAFDWLMGEREAGRELLAEMISSPPLLVAMDADRYFLRSLRASLRKPALATQRTARRRPVSAVAAIAALLLISAVPFWKSSIRPAAPAGIAAQVAAGAVPVSETVLRPPAAESSNPIAVVAVQDREIVERHKPAPAASASILEEMPPSLVAGAGCSIAADDAHDWEAVKAAVIPEAGPAATIPALWASAEPTPETALASNDTSLKERTVGYLPGTTLEGRLPNEALYFSSGYAADGSIPEPSGGLPVLVGFMVLLLHRFRRKIPAGQHLI
jgi:hypothetical protein